MPSNSNALVSQKATRNNSGALIRIPNSSLDTVGWWAEQYFKFEVTTAESSRKVQIRDLQLFISYMIEEEGTDDLVARVLEPAADVSLHDERNRLGQHLQ